MRVTISLNKEASDFLKGVPVKGNYRSSFALIKSFEERGHQVYVVHPSEVIEGGQVVANQYRVRGKELVKVEHNAPIRGDVFFVRSLGEDSSDPSISTRFMSLLYKIEPQVKVCENSAKSTSYEFKPKQKNLPLLWIPQFKVGSGKDLEQLLSSGEKIIAKPSVGHFGSGVVYLEGRESSSQIPDDKISAYCFERFIPANSERRYIVLGGSIAVVRDVERLGTPGKETYGEVWLVEGDCDPNQIDTVRKAIESTKMFYGSVDFRGDFVLEINGSGTSCDNLDSSGQTIFDVTPKLIDLLEIKVKSR